MMLRFAHGHGYTVREVADELGVSRQRVAQILALLKLRPARLGGVGPFILTQAERDAVMTRPPGKLGRPPNAKP